MKTLAECLECWAARRMVLEQNPVIPVLLYISKYKNPVLKIQVEGSLI